MNLTRFLTPLFVLALASACAPTTRAANAGFGPTVSSVPFNAGASAAARGGPTERLTLRPALREDLSALRATSSSRPSPCPRPRG